MFCAVSQNNQQLLEKLIYASYGNCTKNANYGIEILIGQAVSKVMDTIKTDKNIV